MLCDNKPTLDLRCKQHDINGEDLGEYCIVMYIVASHLRKVFANSMAVGQYNGNGVYGRLTKPVEFDQEKLYNQLLTQGGVGTPQYID